MSELKKVSRRYSYSRIRKASASKRKASTKKPSHRDKNNIEERASAPSWAEVNPEEEYSNNGYNNRGYDKQGFSKSGFNKHGFTKSDYGQDGFNIFGFDCEGYSRESRNIFDLTRADYDVDGYDAYGLDCYGYDRQGLNKYGYSTTDYDANGLDKHGYTSNGLYYGVPGTALIPLRHAMVRKSHGDPVYSGELYQKLKDHASMVVMNALIEHEKLVSYQDLITDLSLKWTAWMTLYSLGLL